MTRPDDRADIPLPVTSEVGSEGGSYADATTQRATFEGSVPRREIDVFSGPREPQDEPRGSVRYPTEPPSPPSATEGRRIRTAGWRTGLAGAAAGAAVVLGIRRLRSRGQ